MGIGNKIILQCMYFEFFILSCDENSSGVTTWLLNYFCTKSPPQLKNVSYHGRNLRLSVDFLPRLVLPTTNVSNSNHHNFALELETVENRSVTSPASMTTIAEVF